MPVLEIQGVADDQIRRGLESVNGFSEEGFYRPYEGAPALGEAGATVVRPVVGAVLRDISAWELPSAASSRVVGSFALPPFWVSGSLGLRILYSGAGASTNTINWFYRLDPVKVGTVLPASAATASFTSPGPASAGFPLSVDVPTLIAVDASAILVGWKIGRVIPDSYGANAVWVLGVRPLWYPRRG